MFSRPLLVLQLFMRSSRVQKKRAILTIAAIAWGSLSLLLLLSFGEGLKRQLLVANSGLGRDLAILWPGETTRPWNGMPSGRWILPRVEDDRLCSPLLETDREPDHLLPLLGAYEPDSNQPPPPFAIGPESVSSPSSWAW